MKNIVVFASGGGSNFQSVINAISSGKLEAKISGLITNKTGIKSIERARKNNIASEVISEKEFSEYADYEKVLLEQLQSFSADLLVLAGYLRKIPDLIIESYEGRILNIHPSLLPKYGGKGFYGLNVHRAVIENGDKESGCTVHLVTKIYDDGPVLGQTKVPVFENDTPELLAARVLEEEHILYPKIISEYLKKLD